MAFIFRNVSLIVFWTHSNQCIQLIYSLRHVATSLEVVQRIFYPAALTVFSISQFYFGAILLMGNKITNLYLKADHIFIVLVWCQLTSPLDSHSLRYFPSSWEKSGSALPSRKLISKESSRSTWRPGKTEKSKIGALYSTTNGKNAGQSGRHSLMSGISLTTPNLTRIKWRFLVRL